jgi:hypothetical protein
MCPQQNKSGVSTTNTTNTSEAVYRAAFEQHRPSLMAMTEVEIVRRNALDPTAASITAEGSARRLAEFRDEAVTQFGATAGTQIDELSSVARAARHADVEYLAAASATGVPVLYEGLRGDHRLLMTDADGFANRKLIDPARLEPARNVQGYQALIGSVLVLVCVLREHWAQIKDYTPLTEDDLARIEGNAHRLSAALESRESNAARAAAAELRVRALSKLIHLYEAILRMMTYLRWYQGDVDVIMPSLWAGRGRRARAADDGENPAIDADEPQSPAGPVPNNGGAPFTA